MESIVNMLLPFDLSVSKLVNAKYVNKMPEHLLHNDFCQ